jgi:hypothetical protein
MSRASRLRRNGASFNRHYATEQFVSATRANVSRRRRGEKQSLFFQKCSEISIAARRIKGAMVWLG